MKEKREKENKYSAWIVLLSVLTIGIEIAGAAGIIRVLFSAYPKLYPALHLQGEGKIGMLMLLLWIAAAAAVVFFCGDFHKKASEPERFAHFEHMHDSGRGGAEPDHSVYAASHAARRLQDVRPGGLYGR